MTVLATVAQVAVPAEGVVGLGLGATILIILVPALLRQYAKAQAGVWEIVEDRNAEIVTLRADVAAKATEVELWRGRAYAAGWRPDL